MWHPLELDRETLSAPVAASLRSRTIDVIDWRQDSIHTAFNQSTGGLYRIAGTGRDRGRTVPWSVILKVVRASDGPFGGSVDPTTSNYWKRELELYRSGMLENLPGIRAPRCLGIDQHEAGLAWIWLEDVADRSGSRWSEPRYRLAARRLGEFNGAYVAGRPTPSAGYLSRNWLRRAVGGFGAAFARLPSVSEHPLVRRCWPGDLLDRVMHLWEERETLLMALDLLPQTFCHLDAFSRNLLVDEEAQQVVALDWSYAGIGAVGAELAPMVAASVCFFDADPEQMPRIDQVVFDGYLEGLRAVGWNGHPEAVRLGYTAAGSLRYGLFPLGVFVLDENLRAHFERVFARPVDEILDRWVEVAGFLLELADEARQLMRSDRAREGREGVRGRLIADTARHQST
jgi:hypothetical protein